MTEFPRTNIEHLSLSRLVIGTNWFLGCSHTSRAKDRLIYETMDAKLIADILEVFMNAGVDVVYGIRPDAPHLNDAIKDAEDRTGRKCITIGIPIINVLDKPEALAETGRIMDEYVAIGTDIFMPHESSTDALVDRRTGAIEGMDRYVAMIRERGMIPGLSTHMPQTIPYADESGLDIATYIQLYNAAGFLMHVEVDWVHRIIWNAQKPVITIKPLAAGRLLPLVGLAFSWATLRDCDLVTVGTFTPDEAKEVIEISLSLLERRESSVELQRTRSKRSLDGK